MQVSAFMRSHVVTLPRDATVRMAVDVFDLHQQPLVPVVDTTGAPLGAVVLRDAADRLVRQSPAEVSRLLSSSVESVMSRDCMMVAPSEPIQSLILTMGSNGREAALVVDDNRVVGLVGLAELCRAVCALTPAE